MNNLFIYIGSFWYNLLFLIALFAAVQGYESENDSPGPLEKNVRDKKG